MTRPKIVADIMTRDVIALREEDNLESLEEEMDVFGMRHLPVVDGDKLVGLVSHRDVLRFATSSLASNRATEAASDMRKSNTFVVHVMKRDLKTVYPDTSIQEAAHILAEGPYGCLPVIDALGNLVGIVTERDFLVKVICAEAANLEPLPDAVDGAAPG